MESKYVFGIVIGVVVLLILGGLLINRGVSPAGEESNVAIGDNGGTGQEDTFLGNTQFLDITGRGFSVERVQIFQGDRIIWRNFDNSPHWIASNYHPKHDLYPETGGCVGSSFDSCGAILPGENWTFVFDKVGTWGYHDDYNLQNTGSVVVKIK